VNDKSVVVVGGGVGGLVVANDVRGLLPRRHRVVLLERNAMHAFAPSFLWLMVGDRTRAQITRPLAKLLRPGIELIATEARRIDVQDRQIEVGSDSLGYDYLVLAPGAELAFDTLAGLDAAHTFYTLEGAERLHETLRGFAGGRVAVIVASTPYKCPGAPHEGAMLIADFLRQRGLGSQTEVHLFTPEPQPMPVAGPALGEAVTAMLAGRGIVFHPLHKLTAFKPGERRLDFEGRDSVTADLVVAVPPHRGAPVLRGTGLTNEAGWVPVDAATLRTKDARVFALGDATAIPLPGRWKPDVPLVLPKAGVFAHAQAKVVARRISAEINGETVTDTFCGAGYCMLEAGEDLAGFAYGNFFATPAPEVHLRQMGKAWHLGKVLFESWWLSQSGLRREALRLALTLGGKALRIPVVV
jgi:sulfide:quinone oxidoreductase